MDIPILCALSFIPNPRAKMRQFHIFLRLSSPTGIDYTRLTSSIHTKLTKILMKCV